jgi:hypothetical protein
MIVALLPASPRRRRRIAWLATAGGVLVVVVVAILSLPSPKPIPETFSGRAAVDTPGQARVAPSERRLIDTTVDRFVLAALVDRDLGRAWDLAGPDLRGTSTRADWVAGQTPVLPFPALGKQFHGWTHVVAHTGVVTFNLLVQPRPGATVGATAFSVQVIRRHGTWLVNRWYTEATFTPVGTEHPRIVGPNDFGAGTPGPVEGRAGGARLSQWWLAVPVALFVLGLLFVGVVVARNWLRYRRMRAVVAAERAADERHP